MSANITPSTELPAPAGTPLTQTTPTNHPRDGLAEFLTTFATMHDAMRRDAQRLVTLTERRAHLDWAALQRWWAHLEHTIVQHHRREDDLIFPVIAERMPSIEASLTALDRDHAAIDTTMSTVGVSMAAADRFTLTAASWEFSALLDAHLTREESLVFPAIVEHLGREGFGRIEEQINEHVTLRDLSFDVPWLLDGAAASLRDGLVAGAPAPLRVLLRFAWEPRYRRIAAVVRGDGR